MDVKRWVDRKFTFDTPVELFPVVVERLRGTPARLEERARTITPAHLTRRDGDHWSIQEHAGHLLDMDELHAARLDDFRARLAVLRAADMANRKTYDADHNAKPIDGILREFRRERLAFVEQLDAWPEADLGFAALHPRLKQPMRVIDTALFVAEHDDHHLALMTHLARKFG
jgi:uncharacterized damage-inducible protein DinB